jgi:processive 1,2-diacylglycerol beta-glucosyltransferase
LKKNTSFDVVFADALDYTSPSFKKFYQRTYIFLVTGMSWLWGFSFELLDRTWIQPLMRSTRRFYNGFNARRLNAFLKDRNFDYVVTTHFLPGEVVAALKRTGEIRSRLITVVTDFDVHRIWLNPETDYYAVASEWTAQKLQQLGIAEEKIRVTGIPVNEQFLHPADRGELKKKLGLKENVFTVLIATGSFGIGPIEEILRILETEDDLQTLVVCGHNRGLAERLRRRNYAGAKIFGLVDNMHELMAVSDCMVTKPGGLSIAEALVSQLPMIFFHPIPGQETNNVRVLREYGIGCMPADVQGIAGELRKLKSCRDAHLTALKHTQRLARPAAVRDIISLIK